MRGFAIYLEGGGAGAGSKALLRHDMGEFLQGIRHLAWANVLIGRLLRVAGVTKLLTGSGIRSSTEMHQ